MYGREYGGRVLRFEPSGGLMHASLVLQDKETDSYWSIMTGDSVAGELGGTRLQELPLGIKAQWKDWRAAHPDTLVLSVNGEEHVDFNPYDNYFASDQSFRGERVKDRRLPTKEPVFTFELDGRAYAVPFREIEGGATWRIGDGAIFLFRPSGVAVFYSTSAWIAGGAEARFERWEGVWVHEGSGARFDGQAGRFFDESGVRRLEGFDTFWFNWSMIHPGTEILRSSR